MTWPTVTRLLAAAALTLVPILGLSQHGGMAGSGGMPAGGAMSRPAGGPGMPAGVGSGMRTNAGMTGGKPERRMQAEALQQRYRDLLAFDPRGNLIVRNEIIGTGVTAARLIVAQSAGFVIHRRDALAGLETEIVSLTAPPGMSARKALKTIRAIDPGAVFDFNHIYVESGADGEAGPAHPTDPSVPAAGSGRTAARRVGLIDGGVEPTHAALGSLALHSLGCNGVSVPSAHGTAVASRLAIGFGVAPSANNSFDLYVVDVYCGAPTGGATDAVIRGLAWLVQEGVPVINISLVGPPNALLQRIVERTTARGHLIVAAVGNDGPSAPPLYPAAYPGVIAVTGVDGRGKALIEAGRGAFIAFAAPGADIDAAGLPSGYSPVRGTSFAAPIVASRLALLLERPDRVAAVRAVSELASGALDLGRPGRDPVYGNGCVGCAARDPSAGAASAH